MPETVGGGLPGVMSRRVHGGGRRRISPPRMAVNTGCETAPIGSSGALSACDARLLGVKLDVVGRSGISCLMHVIDFAMLYRTLMCEAIVSSRTTGLDSPLAPTSR